MAKRAVFRILFTLAGLGGLGACAAPPKIAAGNDLPQSEQALKGSTPQVLDADFGQPSLRRTDGQAQVWLYHSPICGMNVFLYPDAHGVPRVAAAVADAGDDPQSCMMSLEHPVAAAALERNASS
ncbi:MULTISPECIES: hypothetical protein [Acidocella]|uniref:hypothetical protein n=1 Tax=Acidocella TaxID=50709 RepID=UPI00028C13CD|nr:MULTISPECIES: hypothetical protein [Acidocella]EKM99668.1 hypothetical protein MXAZACID_09176 [Acidocella sp. MX-AZ02]WBO58314.1 hypothetical protein GT370_14000 [Acidocella sp. MX-AZ03]